MNAYSVTIIPKGKTSSRHHGGCVIHAATPRDAVEKMINGDPTQNTNTKYAQTVGGIVIVSGAAEYGSMKGAGVELFEVRPAGAEITRQITA